MAINRKKRFDLPICNQEVQSSILGAGTIMKVKNLVELFLQQMKPNIYFDKY